MSAVRAAAAVSIRLTCCLFLSLQVLTSIKGTPLYMAPELVQEQPYNHTVGAARWAHDLCSSQEQGTRHSSWPWSGEPGAAEGLALQDGCMCWVALG